MANTNVSDLPPWNNLGDLLRLEEPEYQEEIVRMMITSFTDWRSFHFFFDNHSPNDSIKELRYAIWNLLK